MGLLSFQNRRKMRCERSHVFLCAGGSQSNDQRAFGSIGAIFSKVFDFGFVLLSKVIKTQAVSLGIHDFTKLCLQKSTLARVKQTLKNGILDALPVVDALFCNLPQTAATSGVFRVYVVGNHNQHCASLTSIKTADKHPDHRADIDLVRAPEHMKLVPMVFSRLSKGE